MIIIKSLQEKYVDDNPHLLILGKRVNETLIPFCEKNHFAYTYRYKELESIAEKVESGRFSSWNSIDDLFATTIIIPNLNQEDNVIGFLSDMFIINAIKRRGSTFKSPDVFRFDATRVIAYLKAFGIDKQRIHEISFEIQIRTAFEHAWAAATHSLAYKSHEINWKAMRLASQMKAAVEQLDMLVSGFSEVDKHITVHNWPEVSCKIQILDFVAKCFESKIIPDELRPKDFTRFAENMFALLRNSEKWPKDYRFLSKFIDSVCEDLSKEIHHYNISTFPRSISLLQFCLGTLITKGKLKLPLQAYVPIITEELETLFPVVKSIDARFVIK